MFYPRLCDRRKTETKQQQPENISVERRNNLIRIRSNVGNVQK